MELLKIILPILVIPLIGYLAARSKHLSESECDSVSKFVFTYVIPSLLFMGIANAKIPEKMAWEYLFTYYITVLLIYLLGAVIGKVIFRYTDPEQSVFGMGASYSNAVIVGIPVCVYVLGERSLLPLFIIISVHNLSLFTIGILVAERSTLSFSSALQSFVNVLKQLVATPITGSLIAGGVVNIFNIPIYEPLADGISLLSKAAIPAALFVLGSSLNKYKIHGEI